MMHVLDVESCMALLTVKTALARQLSVLTVNPRAFAPLSGLKPVVFE
jgi:hypothetical protein